MLADDSETPRWAYSCRTNDMPSNRSVLCCLWTQSFLKESLKTPNGSKIGTSVNILISFGNQDCVGHIGAMKRTWACSRWIFCKHLEMTLKGGNKYGLTNIPPFAVKASINSASGSGFQEQNLLHWLFKREANKSISKGPNFLESSRKIAGESCHSVFSSRIIFY